jgi:PBP1b-binding outer membrane lipoprotein LpoB
MKHIVSLTLAACLLAGCASTAKEPPPVQAGQGATVPPAPPSGAYSNGY